MDKVLVTGATGFVGANLVRRLLQEAYDVHIFTRAFSNKWRLADVLSKLSDYTVDILEAEKLRGLVNQIKPDIIFHLATAGIYGGIHLSDKKLIETNFLGTINLFNACQDIDYKCLINTGSSAEYGSKKHPMKETDACEPINMYGVTKCAATLYGSFVAKTKDKPVVAFRLFSPFGPYDDKSRLMTYAITNALQNKELNLANPKAVRDYIYVEDVVGLYTKCIDRAYSLRGEVFNVGSGSQTSIAYVIEKIMQFTHSKSIIHWNAVRPRAYDADRWEANMEKTCKSFDWQPKHNIDEGLERTVEWFQANRWRYE
jgi:nucleoside-diphosphate-sugar epimerase